MPWQQRQRMPLMAYSPIDQGELARHAGLAELAARRGVSPAQLALAWLLAACLARWLRPGEISSPS